VREEEREKSKREFKDKCKGGLRREKI